MPTAVPRKSCGLIRADTNLTQAHGVEYAGNMPESNCCPGLQPVSASGGRFVQITAADNRPGGTLFHGFQSAPFS
jgi:hypothetical protein